MTTETGAGQWGTALSEACSYFGIPLTVYMVKVSYEQKPFRKAVMQTFDAGVIASPSNTTNVGRQILAEDPTAPAAWGARSRRRWKRRCPPRATVMCWARC